jgi:hypothetical protein
MSDATTKLCRKCGEAKPIAEFYTRNGKVTSPCKACGRKAKNAYDAARKVDFHPGGTPCQECGRPVPSNGRGAAPRKFCSRTCASRKWTRDNYNANLRVPKPEHGHPCAWCGQPTPEKKIGGRPRKFCSRECSTDANLQNQRARGYARMKTLERYGLTPATYEALRTTQGGVCAICQQAPKRLLHVDHCHTSGKVRGLLCGPCNRALGLLNDNAKTLRAAASYLEAAS